MIRKIFPSIAAVKHLDAAISGRIHACILIAQGYFTLKMKCKKFPFCSGLCYSTLAEQGWGQPSIGTCSHTMGLHWESTETMCTGKLVLPPCHVRSVQLFAVLFPVYKPWEFSASVWSNESPVHNPDLPCVLASLSDAAWSPGYPWEVSAGMGCRAGPSAAVGRRYPAFKCRRISTFLPLPGSSAAAGRTHHVLGAQPPLEGPSHLLNPSPVAFASLS